MAAAARTAFTNALGRIGINAATRAAIVENGFQTILDLVTVQDEDLDKLPKHLEAWRNPTAAPGAQVRIPFVSLTKLKAMRYWVLAQRCIGVATPSANDFTNDVIAEVLTRTIRTTRRPRRIRISQNQRSFLTWLSGSSFGSCSRPIWAVSRVQH